MTTYENPTPKEGINTTDEHPLKEFWQLVLGIGAVIVLLVVFLLVVSLLFWPPLGFLM